MVILFMHHKKMSSYRGHFFIMTNIVEQKQEMWFDHGHIICVLQEKMSFNHGYIILASLVMEILVSPKKH